MYTQAEASRLRENVERLTGVILPQNIKCEKAPGLCVSVTAEGGSIAAEDLSALSRGFFLAARAVKENTLPLNVKQERHFHSVGAMVDMSRGGVMTVKEPENLAGTVLTWSDGETQLAFDGAELDTGALSDSGLSPAEIARADMSSMRPPTVSTVFRETNSRRSRLRTRASSSSRAKGFVR